MGRSLQQVLPLLALIASVLYVVSADQSFTVRGKVLWPEEETSAAKIKLILSTHGVPQKYAWPQPDGAFVIHGVPAGSHMLDVAAINVIYPQLRLDVSAKGGGAVLATFADNSLQRLPEPLIIRPLAKAEYFEKRTPFNPISFLKSPYGLMLIFGVVAVFLLPMLKVDPEEYKELMQSASPAAAVAAPPASGAVSRSPQQPRRR